MAMKSKTYSRRGWWPDFWSVSHRRGKWFVENRQTGKVLSPRFKSEALAVSWADANASNSG